MTTRPTIARIVASAVAVAGISFASLSSALSAEKPAAEKQDYLAEYQRLLGEGARFNARAEFHNAEAAFRRAAGMCTSRNGPDDPSCGDALVRLGLEISNQGRFKDADGVFRMANRLVRRSASPFDIPRYLVYRAMDLSNRMEFTEARRMIVAANSRYRKLVKTNIERGKVRDSEAKRHLDAILLEFAHGLLVHGGIARRLGLSKEAKATFLLARDVAARVDGVPSWWRDQIARALEEQPSSPPNGQVGRRPKGDPIGEFPLGASGPRE